MANPTPEIDPAPARDGAAVVTPGRGDSPNRIHVLRCSPGRFCGRLQVEPAAARAITAVMPPSARA